MPAKRHNIPVMLRRIRAAIEPYARAAMFELADEGFSSAFEQLVACIISIRTRDEAMIRMARAFFARARTPSEVAAMSVEEIDELIGESTFHYGKARQIHEIARRAVAEFGGGVPCDRDVLLSFKGVGPKCANLVLGIACAQTHIGVDVHVHRVTNRWGYVAAATPEQTMVALEAKLPRAHWVEINELLVPFGKHVCTGTMPKCSACPVFDYCRRVGVTDSR